MTEKSPFEMVAPMDALMKDAEQFGKDWAGALASGKTKAPFEVLLRERVAQMVHGNKGDEVDRAAIIRWIAAANAAAHGSAMKVAENQLDGWERYVDLLKAGAIITPNNTDKPS